MATWAETGVMVALLVRSRDVRGELEWEDI
jgi:hypothetical protein